MRSKIQPARLAFTIVAALLLQNGGVAAPKNEHRFQGVWRGEFQGHTYALVTILAENPLRGTIARGAVRSGADGKVTQVDRDAAMDLFIQRPRVAKGVLRFTTIDPNDGELNYEMKLISPSEATLSVKGTSMRLKRS